MNNFQKVDFLAQLVDIKQLEKQGMTLEDVKLMVFDIYKDLDVLEIFKSHIRTFDDKDEDALKIVLTKFFRQDLTKVRMWMNRNDIKK